jgi:hypothetical protein
VVVALIFEVEGRGMEAGPPSMGKFTVQWVNLQSIGSFGRLAGQKGGLYNP